MIAWVLSNWKPTGVLLLLAFGYGFYSGANHANQEWKAEIASARQKTQDSADRHAEEYETERAEDRAKLEKTREELAREKRNPAYASCHAGNNFMRLYHAAAGN